MQPELKLLSSPLMSRDLSQIKGREGATLIWHLASFAVAAGKWTQKWWRGKEEVSNGFFRLPDSWLNLISQRACDASKQGSINSFDTWYRCCKRMKHNYQSTYSKRNTLKEGWMVGEVLLRAYNTIRKKTRKTLFTWKTYQLYKSYLAIVNRYCHHRIGS